MRTLIKFEYKKLWNTISILAAAGITVITTVFALIYYSNSWVGINQKNQTVSGVSVFSAVKKASKDLEGTMDETYLKNLEKKYRNSFDKKCAEENIDGFAYGYGLTKFEKPNYLVNYAANGPYMSEGVDSLGLDFDFLPSQKKFYEKYRAAVMEDMLQSPVLKLNMNTARYNALKKKVHQLRKPFYIAYCKGIENIVYWFQKEYWIFLLLFVFTLAGIYAKDSSGGIKELTLSSRHGRKKNMQARWIAGNLFTVTMYGLFAGVLFLEHGTIASFYGWKASIQLIWPSCVQNFSAGTGMVLLFGEGLLGTLTIANLVMLLSVKIKNGKITSIFAVALVYELVKVSWTQNPMIDQWNWLNPIRFGNGELHSYVFFGNTPVVYFMLIPLMAIFYITVFHFGSKLSYKKYRIH